MMSGDVKSFFRSKKTHTGARANKPTDGVPKKAVQHHHRAQLLHPTPGKPYACAVTSRPIRVPPASRSLL